MQRTLACALPTHVGESVTIAGWVHRHRRLKSVEFLIVRDRTGLAQVVLPPSAVDSGGTVVAHTSCAFQHRVRNRQPEGGSAGLGTSPCSRIRSF